MAIIDDGVIWRRVPSDVVTPSLWNYFVECDDALHRIYRLYTLNKKHGKVVDICTSSQWFVASWEFAWYLARPPSEEV